MLDLILMFCFLMLVEISISSRFGVSQAEAESLSKRMKTTVNATIAISLSNLLKLAVQDLKPEFMHRIEGRTMITSSYVFGIVGAVLFIIAGIQMLSSIDDRLNQTEE